LRREKLFMSGDQQKAEFLACHSKLEKDEMGEELPVVAYEEWERRQIVRIEGLFHSMTDRNED
jgi:hypothetical protein